MSTPGVVIKPRYSTFVKALDKIYHNPLTAAATTLAAIIVLVALFAPLLAAHSPTVINLVGRLAPPSAEHWFGTDEVDGISTAGSFTERGFPSGLVLARLPWHPPLGQC